MGGITSSLGQCSACMPKQHKGLSWHQQLETGSSTQERVYVFLEQVKSHVTLSLLAQRNGLKTLEPSVPTYVFTRDFSDVS